MLTWQFLVVLAVALVVVLAVGLRRWGRERVRG